MGQTGFSHKSTRGTRDITYYRLILMCRLVLNTVDIVYIFCHGIQFKDCLVEERHKHNVCDHKTTAVPKLDHCL